MADRNGDHGRKITAYILLGVAGYIILANTGLMELIGISDLIGLTWRALWNLVPAATLVVGVLWLSRSDSANKPLGPWLIIMIGAMLLVSQFGLFDLSFGDLFLPMWLVIIAIVIMNPRELLPKRLNASTDDMDGDDGIIKLVAFMGGGELHYSSQQLKGGEVLAIWGGYKIDFTDADMEEDSMEINLICIMGGVEVRVPAHWEVEKHGAVSIMGGFSNKSRCIAEDLELPRKKLIIRGLALMGGGEFHN